MSEAPVDEVVARNHREDGVSQIHFANGGRNTLRLIGRRRQRLLCVDQTKAAGTGAPLAEDHERRCAIGPAIAQVGAASLLTDGDKAVIAHCLFEPQHFDPDGDLGPQPLGLPGTDGQTVADARLLEPRRCALAP